MDELQADLAAAAKQAAAHDQVSLLRICLITNLITFIYYNLQNLYPF